MIIEMHIAQGTWAGEMVAGERNEEQIAREREQKVEPCLARSLCISRPSSAVHCGDFECTL